VPKNYQYSKIDDSQRGASEGRLIFLLSCSVQPGVEIAQWYSARLQAGLSGVRVPAEAGNFSPHYHVQIGSGAHSASYPMGSRGFFPGGKAAGV
jgi:hypothetical protein